MATTINLLRRHREPRIPSLRQELDPRPYDQAKQATILSRRWFIGAGGGALGLGLLGLLPEWVTARRNRAARKIGEPDVIHGEMIQEEHTSLGYMPPDIAFNDQIDKPMKARVFVANVLVSDQLLDPDDGGVHSAYARQIIADDVSTLVREALERQAGVKPVDREVALTLYRRERDLVMGGVEPWPPRTYHQILDDWMAAKRFCKSRGIL